MSMKRQALFLVTAMVLLAAASQPAGAQDRQNIASDRQPVPLTSPGTWISQQDYPSDLRREGVEGATEFELEVDSDGMPLSCRVTSSSGSERLDVRACDRIMQNARFKPPRDNRGNPVVSTYNSRVVWFLENRDPPGESRLEFTVVVGPDGRIGDCEVIEFSGMPAGTDPPECPENYNYRPFLDEDGNPVARRIRTIMQISHEEI